MSTFAERWLAEVAELIAAEKRTGEILDIKTASRGPCTHCGKPVVWHEGLRNWFGDLVHHACAGKWKGDAEASRKNLK